MSAQRSAKALDGYLKIKFEQERIGDPLVDYSSRKCVAIMRHMLYLRWIEPRVVPFDADDNGQLRRVRWFALFGDTVKRFFDQGKLLLQDRLAVLALRENRKNQCCSKCDNKQTSPTPSRYMISCAGSFPLFFFL